MQLITDKAAYLIDKNYDAMKCFPYMMSPDGSGKVRVVPITTLAYIFESLTLPIAVVNGCSKILQDIQSFIKLNIEHGSPFDFKTLFEGFKVRSKM